VRGIWLISDAWFPTKAAAISYLKENYGIRGAGQLDSCGNRCWTTEEDGEPVVSEHDVQPQQPTKEAI
jgi:hypothetical protein